MAGRQAANTQLCPLFNKELRSALRAPLKTSGGGGVAPLPMECRLTDYLSRLTN